MMEFKNLLPHAIEIRGTMNSGYLMQVGCAQFAFGDPDDMLELVKAYLDDPKGMVNQYNAAMDKYGGAPRLVGRDEYCETTSSEGQTAEQPGGIGS
jgi:hypothetical protein